MSVCVCVCDGGWVCEAVGPSVSSSDLKSLRRRAENETGFGNTGKKVIRQNTLICVLITGR